MTIAAARPRWSRAAARCATVAMLAAVSGWGAGTFGILQQRAIEDVAFTPAVVDQVGILSWVG